MRHCVTMCFYILAVYVDVSRHYILTTDIYGSKHSILARDIRDSIPGMEISKYDSNLGFFSRVSVESVLHLHHLRVDDEDLVPVCAPDLVVHLHHAPGRQKAKLF
jgi:hypothetical protein